MPINIKLLNKAELNNTIYTASTDSPPYIITQREEQWQLYMPEETHDLEAGIEYWHVSHKQLQSLFVHNIIALEVEGSLLLSALFFGYGFGFQWMATTAWTEKEILLLLSVGFGSMLAYGLAEIGKFYCQHKRVPNFAERKLLFTMIRNFGTSLAAAMGAAMGTEFVADSDYLNEPYRSIVSILLDIVERVIILALVELPNFCASWNELKTMVADNFPFWLNAALSATIWKLVDQQLQWNLFAKAAINGGLISFQNYLTAYLCQFAAEVAAKYSRNFSTPFPCGGQRSQSNENFSLRKMLLCCGLFRSSEIGGASPDENSPLLSSNTPTKQPPETGSKKTDGSASVGKKWANCTIV